MFRRTEVRDPLSIKARDLWEEYQANRRDRLLKGDRFDDDCYISEHSCDTDDDELSGDLSQQLDQSLHLV